jgi:hypothetical protein
MHNKNEPVIENRHSLIVPSRTLAPSIRLVDRARAIKLTDSSLRSYTERKSAAYLYRRLLAQWRSELFGGQLTSGCRLIEW